MISASDRLKPFADSLQKTDQWMRELMDEIGTDDPMRAHRVLRSTLHALRDRLIPQEATDLAAQLPMLIRGVYFEGWDMDTTPTKERRAERFLDRVAKELVPESDPDPREAANAVFRVLCRHITPGEIHDVVHMLPKEVQELLPGDAARQ